VAHVGRDGERALATDLHAGHAFVPAANDLAAAEAEVERLVAIARAVELAPLPIGLRLVEQPSGVVHRYPPSGRRLAPGSHLAVVLFQLSHSTNYRTVARASTLSSSRRTS